MRQHLEFGGAYWCDDHQDYEGSTEDPRDATCSDCLKRAASYGAASAMRYAAVEAGATQDPELVKERDNALKRVDTIYKALEMQSEFYCSDCNRILSTHERGLSAGGTSWCFECAPHGVDA